MCSLTGKDVGMQNGIEDGWVGGFGLAAAEWQAYGNVPVEGERARYETGARGVEARMRGSKGRDQGDRGRR